MRIFKILLFTLTLSLITTSCFKDNDDHVIVNTDINDFVYKALNAVYLYKAEIPALADNRFNSNQDYANYLDNYTSPEELFESLIYQREVVDRFSILRKDGIALLQQLNGTFKSNGLEFNLYREPGKSNMVFGIVRLVLNNSPASKKGLQRGQIFNAIDNVPMTVDNYSSLLAPDTYTLNFATYNTKNTPETSDDTIESTDQSVTLTKEVYNENPVYLTKILNINGIKIGYLLYNGFTADYNAQLNQAFAELKAGNVQQLVLDLRYNGGGSINSALLLGSMITGQFNGEVFSKLVYNQQLQNENTDYIFTSKLNNNTPLNSLNLNKLYVLTTNGTASASELIINSLKAYIDVVQIGINTTGKTQASVPIFDSPDFGPNDINPVHNYVMLPLVANSINKYNDLVPPTGLVPDIEIKENPANFAILGDPEEPLLAAAINEITGLSRPFAISSSLEAIDSFNEKTIYDGVMIPD